jgi:RHS repeat-associated protein
MKIRLTHVCFLAMLFTGCREPVEHLERLSVISSAKQWMIEIQVDALERHYDPRISTDLPQKTVSYTRGSDKSGTLEAAGGIGGLLARTESSGSETTHNYYHCDLGGNITALFSSDEKIVAHYIYDPFGNTIRASGPLAEGNTLRFSSKEYDPRSNLYYYGYRFYDPNLQRWLNRDPIGEEGGLNLNAFVFNNPILWIDPFGLLVEVLTMDRAGFAGSNTPPGSGGSSFGHTAININGTTYSFGPAGWYVGPTDEYLKRNQFRKCWGQVLKVSEETEKRIKEELDKRVKENKPYSKLVNTCTQAIQNALRDATGGPLDDKGWPQCGSNNGPTPFEFRRDLRQEGKVEKENIYPKVK